MPRASPPTPSTSATAERVSVNDAYLEPARERPNLTILGEALVDQVLWDGRRAVGVRARSRRRMEGIPRAAHRARPPVLSTRRRSCCAQASGRPPISRQLGIAPLQDLPVGEYFFDHPFVRLELKLKPEHRPTDAHARHTNCCVKFSSGLPGCGFNDMIYFSMNHGGFGVVGDPDMFGEAGIHVALFECFSQGQVSLASADPSAQPAVDLAMLSDERDLVRMRKGARELMRIGQHPAVTSITRAVFAGNSGLTPAEMECRDDDAFDDWLLRTVPTPSTAPGAAASVRSASLTGRASSTRNAP